MAGPVTDDPVPCLHLAGFVRSKRISRHNTVLIAHPPDWTITDGIDGRLAEICESTADRTKVMKQSARVTTFDGRLVANVKWLDDFAIRCVRFGMGLHCAGDVSARHLGLEMTLRMQRFQDRHNRRLAGASRCHDTKLQRLSVRRICSCSCRSRSLAHGDGTRLGLAKLRTNNTMVEDD